MRPRWRQLRTLGLPRLAAWAGAFAINAVVIAGLISAWTRPPPLRGDKDGTSAVPIFVVSVPNDSSLSAPGFDRQQTEDPADQPPDDLPAASPLLPARSQPTASASGRGALPGVALPDVDQAAGRPDGLVALACATVFSDPQRARECAGDEILSGWTPDAAGRGALAGTDWAKVAADANRGGKRRPFLGPDPLGGLAPGAEVFAAPDPRFAPDLTGQLGRNYEAFSSVNELNAFRSMRDPRTAIPLDGGVFREGLGNEATVPLSGWRPSYTLREPPGVVVPPREGAE